VFPGSGSYGFSDAGTLLRFPGNFFFDSDELATVGSPFDVVEWAEELSNGCGFNVGVALVASAERKCS